MNKIPVLGTILFAYSFVFTHILKIIRVTWIAVVVNIVLGILLQTYFAGQQAQIQAGNLAAMTNYVTLLLVVMVAVLFVHGVASVGITREALGLPTGRGYLYFPLGRTEWRMFGANVRYILAVFALFFLAGSVSLLAFSFAGISFQAPPEQQEMTPAVLLAGALSGAMFLYAAVSALRMGFFLPATITAETIGGVRRAHELTKRNFWRVLIVAVAVGAPVLLLFTIRNELAEGATGTLNLAATQFFNGVMTVLFWGLYYGAAAYAYRGLVGAGTPMETEHAKPTPFS